MIRDFFKTVIKTLFRLINLEIISMKTMPEPPPVYGDLEKVIHLNRTGVHACYDCPLDKCLILSGFSFATDSWHPFVEACRDMFTDSDKAQFQGSFLEKYYSTWTPRNAADALAGFDDAPTTLTSIASFALHAPWMETSPLELQALMERIILYENRAEGHPELDASSGYGLHGPVSATKGEIEFRRLVNIYERIKLNGYVRIGGDGDVSVIGIEYNNDFRFCIMHGQHRVAAAAALGFETLPVQIVKFVHFNEICHWPQVYRGFWSEKQARSFVKHLFSFDSKAWAEKMRLNR